MAELVVTAGGQTVRPDNVTSYCIVGEFSYRLGICDGKYRGGGEARGQN